MGRAGRDAHHVPHGRMHVATFTATSEHAAPITATITSRPGRAAALARFQYEGGGMADWRQGHSRIDSLRQLAVKPKRQDRPDRHLAIP